jgi:hypothetical protein
MNDDDSTKYDSEDWLDDIAAKIRSSKIPAYPGLPALDTRSQRTPKFRQHRIVAASCCLAMLSVIAITVVWWNRPAGKIGPEAKITASDGDDKTDAAAPMVLRPIEGPVQIISINPAAEFTRMTGRLDRLSNRLNQLEMQVSVAEVQSEAASLLAQYAPNQNTER